ncbi:hypothetical protein SK355_05600 [Candidatus Fukatsuia symbiotica]|uniref:hypothetical protein n=1 Tax=Candidatus Fukatsuia TaxID=1927833 RepID=UPI0009328536|nr:hypothetical protein [Candidatus Fukatsuia symbiotica]MEA9444765.1 hypothetical protein [Candidatus Fukatsuia symbiotica]
MTDNIEPIQNKPIQDTEANSSIEDCNLERKPQLALLRLAIPRRMYTNDHMDYVADVIINLKEIKNNIKGLKITNSPTQFRFFFAELKPIE